MLDNKSILITGGTGTFGKKFTETVLNQYPLVSKIVIFSRNEQNHYQMQQEINHWDIDSRQIQKIKFVIGDVRDYHQLKKACQKIDVIVHAAAIKHIDLAESNPLECIKTNIGGAENIIEIAQNFNIKQILAISTDKACSPTSIYGASKLCADKLFIDANNEDNIVNVIRFANFFGSSGSVVPFFQKEKENNFLPITHLEATRFSLTIQNAVDFAIDILNNSIGGEIFIPKLASYKIIDLASAIAPNAILKEVGLRQSEKIHEEMLNTTEALNSIETDKYFVIIPKKESEDKYIKHYKAKKIKEDIRLVSNENKRFLSKNDLIEMMNIYLKSV